MNADVGVMEVHGTSAQLPDLVGLFERYRGHYGQPENLDASREWVRSHLAGGVLRGFIAHREGEPAGMALVAATPASLRLGHFWLLRDLYVGQRHRRHGVGRALVSHVREAAAADGALRLTLTTEADNVGALALYGELGFEPVGGYTSMSVTTQVPS